MLACLRTLMVYAALGAAGFAGPAAAQGKLEARYTATIAGLPIGKGTWVVTIGESQYSAAASGVTTGLMRVFMGGEGTTAAHGVMADGHPVSSIFASTIKMSHKTDEVRLTVAHGNVKDVKVEPPVDPDPERLPITETQRRGIEDPMTASLLRVPGEGDPLTPQTCKRTVAVFDGRLRYDLQLAYKRMERVKADKGYAGPVLVCSVNFAPIGGFVPSRRSIRYLTATREIEVWLAPIAGTRVLVPYRIQGPTPIGEARIAADQFVTQPSPKRASANGVKVQ